MPLLAVRPSRTIACMPSLDGLVLSDATVCPIEMPLWPDYAPVHPSGDELKRLERLTPQEALYVGYRWGTDARPIALYPLGWGEFGPAF